jgi:hypothetical protein
MITAHIVVSISQFRPLGGIFPISAKLEARPPVPGVSVSNGTIIIKGTQPVTLIFQMPDTAFVFIGVAFDADTPDADVGAEEFPRVTINRTASSNGPANSLIVHDANRPEDSGKGYSYVILVQRRATGEIGIIDPVIKNEDI